MQVLVIGIVLFVAACGGGSSDSAPPAQGSSSASSAPVGAGQVTAGQTGFGVSASEQGSGLPDYVWAVAVVRNGTDRLVGVNASFAVYDAAGKVLGQSDTSAPLLRAGVTMPVGTIVEVPAGSTPARTVTTVSELSGLSTHDDHPDWRFTTAGVRYVPGPAGTGKVVGELVSGYQEIVKQAYVSVVCYDSGGKIVGGGEHYVDAIGAGQKVGFETDTLTVTGKPGRCEAFGSPSGAS